MLTVCLFIYPVFIFLTLVVFEKDMSIVSLGMLLIGVAAFAFNSKNGNKITPIIMCLASLLFIITKSEMIIRFYPFWITGVFAWVFLSSVLKKDPIIFHIALTMSPAIKNHPGIEKIRKYCFVWNWVWVCYFAVIEAINLYMVFYGTTRMWAVFNGCISYLAQGFMFIVQFSVNFFFNRKIDKEYSFDRRGVRQK